MLCGSTKCNVPTSRNFERDEGYVHLTRRMGSGRMMNRRTPPQVQVQIQVRDSASGPLLRAKD